MNTWGTCVEPDTIHHPQVSNTSEQWKGLRGERKLLVWFYVKVREEVWTGILVLWQVKWSQEHVTKWGLQLAWEGGNSQEKMCVQVCVLVCKCACVCRHKEGTNCLAGQGCEAADPSGFVVFWPVRFFTCPSSSLQRHTQNLTVGTSLSVQDKLLTLYCTCKAGSESWQYRQSARWGWAAQTCQSLVTVHISLPTSETEILHSLCHPSWNSFIFL